MRIINKFFLLLFLSIESLSAYAQYGQYGQYSASDLKSIYTTPSGKKLDLSDVECIYDYWVHDTVLDKWEQQEMILLVGKQYSKYMDYQYFREDSILCTMDRNKLTTGKYLEIKKKHGLVNSKNRLSYVLKNRKNGILQVYDKVMMDRFVYADSLPKWNWELHKETKKYCGYLCHKATTHFRGRDWTAWYCDVPVSEGPWKFSGLPGLILAIYDASANQRFIANTVRKRHNAILQTDLDEMKTTRKRFNKALKEYKENAVSMIQSAGLAPKIISSNGDTDPGYRRIFFNSIELE